MASLAPGLATTVEGPCGCVGERRKGRVYTLSFQAGAKPLQTSSGAKETAGSDLGSIEGGLLTCAGAWSQWSFCIQVGSRACICLLILCSSCRQNPQFHYLLLIQISKLVLGQSSQEPASQVTMDVFPSCIFSDHTASCAGAYARFACAPCFYTSRSCICISDRHSRIQFNIQRVAGESLCVIASLSACRKKVF